MLFSMLKEQALHHSFTAGIAKMYCNLKAVIWTVLFMCSWDGVCRNQLLDRGKLLPARVDVLLSLPTQ